MRMTRHVETINLVVNDIFRSGKFEKIIAHSYLTMLFASVSMLATLGMLKKDKILVFETL